MYLPCHYRLVSLFGLIQHSDAAAAVVTQALGQGLGSGAVAGPSLSADSMAIVLQMLVRGQGQDHGQSQGQGQSNSSGGSIGVDVNSDYRLVIDLFDLYLKQHNQLQQQLQQQHALANNNPSFTHSSPSPSPGLPAKLFSPVLQALAYMGEYDLMLSLLQVGYN